MKVLLFGVDSIMLSGFRDAGVSNSDGGYGHNGLDIRAVLLLTVWRWFSHLQCTKLSVAVQSSPSHYH